MYGGDLSGNMCAYADDGVGGMLALPLPALDETRYFSTHN